MTALEDQYAEQERLRQRSGNGKRHSEYLPEAILSSLVWSLHGSPVFLPSQGVS